MLNGTRKAWSKLFSEVYRKHKQGRTQFGVTYEAEGKTHVTIFNKFAENGVMITAYNQCGFVFNNGLRSLGPTVVFPNSIFGWNVSSAIDINQSSLCLFTVLKPKPDIVVIGYGDKKSLNDKVHREIIALGRAHGISFEVLPTEDACSTFNFLVYDNRCVGGAFVPPAKFTVYNDQDILLLPRRNKVFEFKQQLSI